MPNYGYRCQTCQREFEMLQRMIDPPQAACPECGGAGTRLFYPTGILFKGSGFYKTDSRTASPTPAAASTDAAKPAADGGGDAVKPAPATKESPAPSPKSTTPATPPAAKPAAST